MVQIDEKTMKTTNKDYFLLLPFLVLALLISTPVQANTVLQGHTIVHYNKIASDQLSVDIRPLDAVPIGRVSARLGDIELPVTKVADYPSNQQRTGILFLVDTSDPRRQQAVDRSIAHIEQLLTYNKPHYQYGLARFDTDLHFLTSPGSSPQTISDKAKTLKAVGKTTELYRNTLGAIRQLARYPSDRKFLFLLSDGRAEDRAYFHRDVVKAAISNNISIFTIGYADNVSLTVELQTLRRLSEETGGQYLSTRPGTYELDTTQLQQMFATIDLGADFKINLSPAIKANYGGTQEIDLSISSGTSLSQVSVPTKLPPVKPTPVQPAVIVAPQPAPATEPAAAASPPPPQIIIERIPDKSSIDLLDPVWILIAISLVLVAISMFLVARIRDRKSDNVSPTPAEPEKLEDAYAWLEVADGTANPVRYPVRSADTKIGRYRGNDIALHDSAISRYHAEIHFTDDGRFIITDMGSKNGIQVNDKEVLEQQLHNNDIIEIGDIRLKFIIPEQLAEDLEDTQMFKTQVPGT
jgi:hypothetical protein